MGAGVGGDETSTTGDEAGVEVVGAAGDEAGDEALLVVVGAEAEALGAEATGAAAVAKGDEAGEALSPVGAILGDGDAVGDLAGAWAETPTTATKIRARATIWRAIGWNTVRRGREGAKVILSTRSTSLVDFRETLQ